MNSRGFSIYIGSATGVEDCLPGSIVEAYLAAFITADSRSGG